MKKIAGLCLFLAFAPWAAAQETGSFTSAASAPLSEATPWPVIQNWDPAQVPWDLWFKKNALVSDKGNYVELFWNAQDFKANFAGEDAKLRFAQAALALVKRLYPAAAKADAVKVDIVYVLERDSYGEPSWDSLQQAAHLEFSKSKTAKKMKDAVLTSGDLKNLFTQIELY